MRAHFQWSTSFRNANPSAHVSLDSVSDQTPDLGAEDYFAYQSQDAYSDWGYIYTGGADTWAAEAYVESGCVTSFAQGTDHDYTTGSDSGVAGSASC